MVYRGDMDMKLFWVAESAFAAYSITMHSESMYPTKF